MENFVLLLTASIAPTTAQKDLAVTNYEERLESYVKALHFYIEKTSFKRIVFVENTNFSYDYSALKKLAESKGVELEVLIFQGDFESVIRQGKGYGENECMLFAQKESSLLKPEDYVFKVSGRYIVENIDNIVSQTKGNVALPLYLRKDNGVGISTIAFCMQKKDLDSLGDFSSELNDDQGRWYEIVLREKIHLCGISLGYMYPAPRFRRTRSGSSGKTNGGKSPLYYWLKNSLIRSRRRKHVKL